MIQATLRQKATLAGLAAVLAAVLWIQRGDETPAPGPAPAGPGALEGQGVAAGEAVAGVRLDLLQASGGQDDGARNPFEFGMALAPPAPPAAPAPPPPAPIAARGTGVPPIPLSYIGRIDLPGGGDRVAVLSDRRGNVFHGREGDVIEGRYRVLRVGPESADLAYLDGRGQQTFQMSGR